MGLCVKLGVMRKDEEFDSTQLKTKCIFVSLNFIYLLITIIPTGLLFKYKYGHLGALLVAIGSSIWQGANYYIEVFSERYHNSLEQKAKQLEEQYLYVDENLDSLLHQNCKDIPSDISDFDAEYDTSDEYTDGDSVHHSESHDHEHHE